MAVEFDPIKDAINVRKHGISLRRAQDLDIDRALTAQDTRVDYGEDRFIAIGPIGPGLYVLVYTRRSGILRAISLRPASNKEKRLWLST